MRGKYIIPISLTVITFIGIVALLHNNNSPVTSDNSEPIKIAASFAPINDLVKQVGGDKVNTIQILPDGSSPHTYEPTAADQEKLVGTQLAFIIGQNFDNWAVSMLDAAAPGYKLQDLSTGITLLSSTDADEPGNDPHYWLSYTNAAIIVNEIRDTLVAFDPLNKDLYTSNAADYIQKLAVARTESIAKISTLTDKHLITFHAAFQYFAKDLGLTVVTTIEPYAGQEPTAQYLAKVGQYIKDLKIKTLFREPQLSDAVVKALAEDYGVKIGTLNPEGNSDLSFLDMMAYNVDTIVSSLKGN